MTAARDREHRLKHDGSCEDWCHKCAADRVPREAPAASPASSAEREAAIETALTDLIGAHRIDAGLDGQAFPRGWLAGKREALLALMRGAPAAGEDSKLAAERAALLDLIPPDCRVVCREGGGPESLEGSLALSLGRLAHRYAALLAAPPTSAGAERAVDLEALVQQIRKEQCYAVVNIMREQVTAAAHREHSSICVALLVGDTIAEALERLVARLAALSTGRAAAAPSAAREGDRG